MRDDYTYYYGATHIVRTLYSVIYKDGTHSNWSSDKDYIETLIDNTPKEVVGIDCKTFSLVI